MKVYHLVRKQFLPLTLEEAWAFFSSPHNLALITPSKLNFKILNISGKDKMHVGQHIHYNITILPCVRVDWHTEITHVDVPFQFVDEQVSGPYAFWHHLHRFEEVGGGVEMVDELEYAIPMGWLGRVVNFLFVKKELNRIFDYRYATLEKRFEKIA